MEEKLISVLRQRACRGACRLEDKTALARELGVSRGKLAALLYSLCGQGRILQEGDIILILSD